MKCEILVQIPDDTLTSIDGEFSQHELANTIRRTAHAIEGSDPLQPGDGGAVLDISGRIIGSWSIGK